MKYLENSNEEIFIDTIGANHDASVKYLYECWTKKGNAYYWFNQNYINDASVVSYFIVNSKQPRPYIGSVVGSGKVVTSYPIMLYGDNLAGICSTDKELLFDLIEKSFDKNSMLIPACCRNFGDFKLREIDFSVSFVLKSKEECDEARRLFEHKRFPYHHINLEGGTQGTYANYDYEYGDCFGSYSDNIKMYDKTEEMLDDHDEKIVDYTMRIEINCFRDVKEVTFRNKPVNELFENANRWFLALLKKYNLIYDFLPKKEYFEKIETYLNTKKDEYLKDKNKKGKKYQAYIKRDVESIIAFLKKINDIGAEAAYKEDGKLYKACLSLTNEMGIDILYTYLGSRFNYFDNVIYRKNSNDYFVDDAYHIDSSLPEAEETASRSNDSHYRNYLRYTLMPVKYTCCYLFISDHLLIILFVEIKNMSIGKYSFYKLE